MIAKSLVMCVFFMKFCKDFEVQKIGKYLELAKVHVDQYEFAALNIFLILVNERGCVSITTRFPVVGCSAPFCILLPRFQCFKIVNELSSPTFQQVGVIVLFFRVLLILMWCGCRLSNSHIDHLRSNRQKETYSLKYT